MMPCLKTFVASIRVSRAREVSRPRPSLGGDPEDRRHQKRNGKRRSPDPELARARGRDRRYRAGTRLADSKRNGKGVEGRTGRTNRAAVYKMCRPCWAAAIFSVCSSVDCFIVPFSPKLSESRNCVFAQKHTLRGCPLALTIRIIFGLIQTLSVAVCVCLCLPRSAFLHQN